MPVAAYSPLCLQASSCQEVGRRTTARIKPLPLAHDGYIAVRGRLPKKNINYKSFNFVKSYTWYN